MILLDVVKSMYEGTEGNFYVIMVSYINLVAGLLQDFLFDHAYN